MMVAAKIAEGGVVDRSPRNKPDEIDRVFDFVFDLAAAANTADGREQQHFAKHARMDRWLAERAMIFRLPVRPIQPIEHLVQSPHRMILRDPILQCIANQHELIPGHRGILPVAHFGLSLTHRSSVISSATFVLHQPSC